MRYDVISIGSAFFDVFVFSSDVHVVYGKNDAGKKMLTIPYGTKNYVDRLVFSTGGGGTNTAVGFSRLGLKAAVVARSGWDFAGRAIRNELKKEKVDDALLVQLEKEDTDYSTFVVGPDGESSGFVYRGQTRLEESLINFRKINAKWLCVSSLEGNLNLLEKIISFGKKNGIKIALNPGRKEIEQRQKLAELISLADVVVVNQGEATKLLGFAVLSAGDVQKKRVLQNGVFVITRGKKGAWLFDRENQIYSSEAFDIDMVESSGAGDAFFSGFLGGVIKGLEIKDAFKLGLANGASVVTQVGTKSGLIREENIENWLSKPLAMNIKKE